MYFIYNDILGKTENLFYKIKKKESNKTNLNQISI